MENRIDPELEALIDKLPPHIQKPLCQREDLQDLLEVVMDLGREPEARFPEYSVLLTQEEVTQEDLEYVTDRISPFGDDNRAGIERTLHRISAIRNRAGRIIGLTLRVGRAVYGTVKIIEDLVLTGKSILLLGKPGVGKTTMLREVARVLANDARKRVIVVDTSNEIAGDGDIPHPGIGRARRMQVKTPALQHAVMIEAVENHMPEVIIIDEIGTEADAHAARTIAERGVQLVATAHGNTLENLLMNPTLSDLVGGIHTVTLSDEEARRRHTQKTVLERRAPPTFDILVEIQGWNRVAVHEDVAEVVDRLLRGHAVVPEVRTLAEDGGVRRERPHPQALLHDSNGSSPRHGATAGQRSFEPRVVRILPYGVNKGKLQQALKGVDAPIQLVGDVRQADLLLTTKNYYRRRTQALRNAEEQGKPIYVIRKNTLPQIQQFLRGLARKYSGGAQDSLAWALEEAEEAAMRVNLGEEQRVVLSPQSPYIRHLQHRIAEKYGLSSTSTGREPARQVVIYRP